MHLWALRPGIDHRFRALTAGHMTLCSSLIQLLHASTKCTCTCTFTTSARAGCHNLEHLFNAEAAAHPVSRLCFCNSLNCICPPRLCVWSTVKAFRSEAHDAGRNPGTDRHCPDCTVFSVLGLRIDCVRDMHTVNLKLSWPCGCVISRRPPGGKDGTDLVAPC